MAAKTAEILMHSLRGLKGCSSCAAISPREAYEVLKRLSRQDFGHDMEAWDAWVCANRGRVNREGQDVLRALLGQGRGRNR